MYNNNMIRNKSHYRFGLKRKKILFLWKKCCFSYLRVNEASDLEANIVLVSPEASPF